jgi:hypothetical protein
MGIRGQLQCKALRGREKSRRRKNNVYQWENNEKSNEKTMRRTMETMKNPDLARRPVAAP